MFLRATVMRWSGRCRIWIVFTCTGPTWTPIAGIFSIFITRGFCASDGFSPKMNGPAEVRETGDASSLAVLDGLRGLAAAYVMVGHARWLLWEGYAKGYALHPSDYSFFQKGLVYFFAFFKFGEEAVLFFFVLSGFVI